MKRHRPRRIHRPVTLSTSTSGGNDRSNRRADKEVLRLREELRRERDLRDQAEQERDQLQEWLDDIRSDPAHMHNRYQIDLGQFSYFSHPPEKWKEQLQDLVDLPFDQWRLVFHPDDRDLHESALEQAREKQVDGVAPFEYRARALIDNTYRWFHISGTYRFNDQGEAVARTSCVTDIEQISEEPRLKEIDARVRDVQESIPTGLFSVDGEGRFTYANPAFLHMFGFESMDELEHLSTKDLYADVSERPVMLERLKTRDVFMSWVWQAKRKDGTPFWASSNVRVYRTVDGRIERVHVNVLDVTEQVNGQEELRRQNRFQQLLLRLSRLLLEPLDPNEDRLTYALEKLSGIVGTERIGVYLIDKKENGTRTAIRSHLAVAPGSSGLEWENAEKSNPLPPLVAGLYDRMKVGQILTVDDDHDDPDVREVLRNRGAKSVILFPFVNSRSYPGFVLVESLSARHSWDVSEIRLLRTATDMIAAYIFRQRTEASMRSSLRAKELLLKEVNHRVKNNLQVISSLLDTQLRTLVDPRAAEAVARSRDRVQAMARLHDTLQFSGQSAEVNFRSYLNLLVNNLTASLVDDPGRVHLAMQMQPVMLSLDKAVPASLLVNELLTNSLKHAFPGDREGRILVQLELEEGGVLLTVEDDGVGLAADHDHEITELPGTQVGQRLIRLMVDQISGSVIIAPTHPGVRTQVHFPIH